MQKVIDRHDILRTAFMWEDLSTPAQVVLRRASLSVTELMLDSSDGSITDQIVKLTDPNQHRIDLAKAPLVGYTIAQDTDDRWIVVEAMHHIIGDNSAMAVMKNEIHAFFNCKEESLLEPQPFRNLISQVRSGPSPEVHRQFFTKMLHNIDTPALPYGLSDIHDDGVEVSKARLSLPKHLNDKLRGHAQRLGVSLASISHLAWAQ
ncbi:hypothetical protein BGX27_006275, partial [Mortierella sp. AM989]